MRMLNQDLTRSTQSLSWVCQNQASNRKALPVGWIVSLRTVCKACPCRNWFANVSNCFWSSVLRCWNNNLKFTVSDNYNRRQNCWDNAIRWVNFGEHYNPQPLSLIPLPSIQSWDVRVWHNIASRRWGRESFVFLILGHLGQQILSLIVAATNWVNYRIKLCLFRTSWNN